MTEEKLNEAIYDRYIRPTERERTKRVGLEFEFPIVNKLSKPVDFEVVHSMSEEFVRHFSFSEILKDDDGYIYCAIDEKTGDSVSFDCSYNTIEYSLGADEDINIIFERFKTYYNYTYDKLGEKSHTITGMGINPHYGINKNVPVVNERYRMLFHHLCSYTDYGDEILFHDHPNFGLFSCASQVQLDVDEKNLVKTLNTFTKLEPLKALIFANSVWQEDKNEFLCSRDYFWRNSLHGLNRHNVDMYGLEFESIDEVIMYIKSMSLYCVKRDGRYVNFTPTPLLKYFTSDAIEGEIFDGKEYKKITIQPEIEDLKELRSFKFEDLTFRGTVEFRSVCEQPLGEIMASGAFHAGLMESLSELSGLLEDDYVIYHKGYNASELRRIFVKKELPDTFDKKELSDLLLRVLGLAKNGLTRRGFGEEKYIDPLFERAEKLLSPAKEMLDGISSGKTMADYIEKFGKL
ncbi:MAG: glutamylcysteine synthetase [Eubacterium sp.]|nr:glutamylcysteine synthetase [Eubacterium sp.]